MAKKIILQQKMKTITCCLGAALPLLVACTELACNSSMPYGEQYPLKIRFVEGGPYTKAETPINESLIEDMNVFIFSPDKALVIRGYFPDGNVSFEEFVLSAKTSYSIYAVANWGEELECATVGELESLEYGGDDDLASQQNGKGAGILSGKRENVYLSFNEPVIMELKRLVGKVNVKCNFSSLASGVELAVNKVSLKNVPVEVALFKDNVASEVGDGGSIEGDALRGISNDGVEFYMFENMQGYVAGASGNKDKANRLDEGSRSVCSYIEMECSLLSKSKRGEIIYRFYLGGKADCNVLRNTSQTVTVNFIGEASQKENSVSVDNSALLDRVTEMRLYPSVISFAPGNFGKTYQCWVELLPATAYDKSVTWSSSDENVATVDQTGFIRTVGVGECSIWAHCQDNPSIGERCIVQVR